MTDSTLQLFDLRHQPLVRGSRRGDVHESEFQIAAHPFPPPETGKIAVKVINHYGDEVMKVYEVA
jgi:hypothetical protein